jgi:hypothetical protein
MREGVTLRAEARTPHGPSFLDGLTVDLDVGGIVVILGCCSNDLHVDCSHGLHKLGVLNGELRLLPGHGFRQKLTSASLHLPAKYVLHVEIEELLESREHIHPPLGELLLSHARCLALQPLAPFVDKLPQHCTVLAPLVIPRALGGLEPEALLRHLTIPVALFFDTAQGGVETTLDGAAVRIQMLANGKVAFDIQASVEAPALKLVSSAVPLRCLERFQVVYVCD